MKLLTVFKEENITAVCSSYKIANPEKLLPSLIYEKNNYRHIGNKETVKFFGSKNVTIRHILIEKAREFNEGYKKTGVKRSGLSYKIAFSPDEMVAPFHNEALKKYLKRQYRHGFWRMKRYKTHPDMTGGDDYTKLKAIIATPLAILNQESLPIHPMDSSPFFLTTILMALILTPTSIKIDIKRKDTNTLLLMAAIFLRGYISEIVMFVGFSCFFLRYKS